MPKYDNPVRGKLRCPVCQSVATAHQCGEGQLIATGEPPKNSRNIGLLYYRCPECGNSPISKKVSEYVETHRVDESTDLLPLEAAPEQVRQFDEITEPDKPNVTEPAGELEASQDKALNRETNESAPPPKPASFPVKRVLAGLGVLIFMVWALCQLMPKKDNASQGGEHEPT
ncbi:hypothetical protein Q8W40_13760 [Vibrio penaeicida]|uniref:hypothetical protein n=1 Tax=Vibrio penaeicida TaxID=104609 RepID=UPI0027376AA9|nr:hypothetical protein [Vibrio penaeicida]MDP2573252.1 hypothetical protein [Vibrio penaeicida]